MGNRLKNVEGKCEGIQNDKKVINTRRAWGRFLEKVGGAKITFLKNEEGRRPCAKKGRTWRPAVGFG